MEAIKRLGVLHTFDYSNNTLPLHLTESIVAMLNKFGMLNILCLDHCEMSDAICKQIFKNINNQQLQFLNISWNNLSGDSLEDIVRILELNPDLQKLAM